MTSKRGEPKSRPAPPKEAVPKARAPRFRTARAVDRKPLPPELREPAPRTSRLRRRPVGGTAAADTAPSRTRTLATDTDARRPVLQRRSFGSTLARAAVMAVAIIGMVAFAVALAKVTLVPSPASVKLIHTNLRPGASIRAYLDQPALRDTVKQIGGNILLGVPFGILLPMLFPKARGFIRVAVITALVMVIVEAAQGAIVEGRAFDIDDVILNTTGALIGYLLLGRRLGLALHPRRTHWWHRYRRDQNTEV
ncbi:VanZ family protein [Streptomyces sp. NBC_01190]|uniref:VanZ family protein n=1 Tax=Streptomyces sp. NBC_01190 TaxID=2903767 RepID=UPI00386F9DDC